MIETSNVRIEVRTDKLDAWADTRSYCSGFVEAVEFTPAFGGAFFLAHKLDEPKRKALIIAPCDRWEGDIVDAGWVIESRIGHGEHEPKA